MIHLSISYVTVLSSHSSAIITDMIVSPFAVNMAIAIASTFFPQLLLLLRVFQNAAGATTANGTTTTRYCMNCVQNICIYIYTCTLADATKKLRQAVRSHSCLVGTASPWTQNPTHLYFSSSSIGLSDIPDHISFVIEC